MQQKRVLFTLFMIMFLVMAGFGIIIPVLPFYAEELGATPTQLGLLMAVYSLMQFIFSPMWGKISDKVGRKPIILVGILGLSLSFFMMAIATQLWMLFVARIFGGILSAANMPTVTAYVADITSEEDRSKGMGMIGAATGIGFIFGPAIGGVFSKIGLNAPFYLAGIVSFITFLLVIFILKESKQHVAEQNEQAKQQLSEKFGLSSTSVLYFLYFFISLSLAGLEATFAYFAAERADISAQSLGYAFMVMGLASAFVQGSMGKLTKIFKETTIIRAGIIVSAIGFALILLIKDFMTATIFLAVFGIGNGVIRPSVLAFLTKMTKGGHGAVTGNLASFDSLGRVLGPVIGGYLYTQMIELPYISGIALSLFALILFQVFTVRLGKVGN